MLFITQAASSGPVMNNIANIDNSQFGFVIVVDNEPLLSSDAGIPREISNQSVRKSQHITGRGTE
jgi:hypothetical protein